MMTNHGVPFLRMKTNGTIPNNLNDTFVWVRHLRPQRIPLT